MNWLTSLIPPLWQKELPFIDQMPQWNELALFLKQESKQYTLFPPTSLIFNSLMHVDPKKVKVLILGQDPYHDFKQANGLAFSVSHGTAIPRSLKNIFLEMSHDLNCPIPLTGDLTAWAQQGVLLLNTVLTVRAHQANSHAGHGWEVFTDAVVTAVAANPQPTVFILWGNHAQKKIPIINNIGKHRHHIIASAHPSPLSAQRGFFGSRPFSKTNQFLIQHQRSPIQWSLLEEPQKSWDLSQTFKDCSTSSHIKEKQWVQSEFEFE